MAVVFTCPRDKHEMNDKSKKSFEKFLAGKWKLDSNGLGHVMLRSMVCSLDDECEITNGVDSKTTLGLLDCEMMFPQQFQDSSESF